MPGRRFAGLPLLCIPPFVIMSLALQYGVDSQVDVDLPADVLRESNLAPRGNPLSDVGEAVRSVLKEPLAFPPVEKMIIPGDKVTIVLSPELMQAPLLVNSVMDHLAQHGIGGPDQITVLRPPQPEQTEDRSAADEMTTCLEGRASLLTHVPGDKTELCYLGVSPYRYPVYLNKALVEADAVILIGATQLDSTLAYHGPQAALYPTYADEPVLRRYRSPRAVLPGDKCDTRIRSEVERINLQLGVRFAVQVVPGQGEEILHVVAGDIDAVAEETRRLSEHAWGFEVPHRASLVVATISGPPSQHTWDNVGRALANAMQVVEEGGAVVLCTDLDQAPMPGVQALIDHADVQDAVPWICRKRPVDIMPALAIARVLDHARVYLLSGLEEALVEDLEMSVVSDPSEVARLTSRNDSCLFLSDAHRLRARAVDF